MEGKEEGGCDGEKGRSQTTKSPHPPLLPITTPLTVHTGMISSEQMVKYLVAKWRACQSSTEGWFTCERIRRELQIEQGPAKCWS